MVDHETLPGAHSFSPEVHFPPQRFPFNRQYSVKELTRDLMRENDVSTAKSSRRSSLHDTETSKVTGKCDSKLDLKKISIVYAAELLNRSSMEYENIASAKDVRSLENAYKNVMEKFLFKMGKFLRSTKEIRNEVIKSLYEFRMIARSAAQVTVATSAAHTALAIGSLAQKFFHFSWHPRISLISTVIMAVSFTGSCLALTHMKRTTTDIGRDVRRANRFLQDLATAHRRGNWIDERVTNLFPFGIDMSMVDKKALEGRNFFKDKYSFKKYLCSLIIHSNIQKDETLLANEEFLTRVKLFVENPSAEIWWNRIRTKLLLEKVCERAAKLSSKDFIMGHEVYIHRTALYLYPTLIPFLVSSMQSEEIRYICGCIAGIIALTDLGKDESEEVQMVKEISQSFEKDFKEIKKISEILNY